MRLRRRSAVAASGSGASTGGACTGSGSGATALASQSATRASASATFDAANDAGLPSWATNSCFTATRAASGRAFIRATRPSTTFCGAGGSPPRSQSRYRTAKSSAWPALKFRPTGTAVVRDLLTVIEWSMSNSRATLSSYSRSSSWTTAMPSLRTTWRPFSTSWTCSTLDRAQPMKWAWHRSSPSTMSSWAGRASFQPVNFPPAMSSVPPSPRQKWVRESTTTTA